MDWINEIKKIKSSNNFDELCDELDAFVFSGDILVDDNVRKEFINYLDRWRKEVKNWADIEKDIKETNKEV